MNAETALEKVLSENPGMTPESCLDFGSFFAFSLRPASIPKDAPYCTGVMMTAIQKDTGRVFDYDITSDPEGYFTAEKVLIEGVDK